MLSLKHIEPDAAAQAENRHIKADSIEGTIQRVNYRTGELRVIAEGHPWDFALSEDCRLWFNGKIAPFRCFQPLDHIWIVYADNGSEFVAVALYLWNLRDAAIPHALL
jgi:hypothetical protein